MIDVHDQSPIFDIVDDGYYVGLWYLAGRGQDFLASVFKLSDDPGLQFRYRFRYYNDDKIFFDETADTKSTWDADLTGKDDDEAIFIVDSMAAKMIKEGYVGSRLPWLVKKRYIRRITRCDGNAYKRMLLTLPFAHAKVVKTRDRSASS